MILLYAHEGEIQHISLSEKVYEFCIGVGACWLPPLKPFIENSDGVILFGSCGLLSDYNEYKSQFIEHTEGDGVYSAADLYNIDRIKLNELFTPHEWAHADPKRNTILRPGLFWTNKIGSGITSQHSVRDRCTRLRYSAFAHVVDQESYLVGEMCEALGVPWVSVRYVIDKCDRRAMPRGINHFWKKMQHRRMQKKFSEELNVYLG